MTHPASTQPSFPASPCRHLPADPNFSIAAISLPTSARQREQQAALEAALEHSSLEVQDLLAALDATAVATGPAAASGGGGGPAVAAGDSPQLQAAERAVLAVRQSLAAAHDGVQGARRRVQEAAGEAEGLKRQHGAVRQQVEQLQLAVDGAQAGVEAALQDKQGAERAVARWVGGGCSDYAGMRDLPAGLFPCIRRDSSHFRPTSILLGFAVLPLLLLRGCCSTAP